MSNRLPTRHRTGARERPRRVRAYAPGVETFEPKALLSTAAVPGPAVDPPARAVPSISALIDTAALAVPDNPFLTAAEWSSLHDEYVAKAERGGYRVIFLGDSTTYLWTDARKTPLTSEVRHRFVPVRGTAAWKSTIAPLHAVDDGIPGDTSGDLVWRVLHGEMQGNPKVAVVQVGINDLVQGRTPEATAQGIIDAAKAIRATSPGTKILLLGMLVPSGIVPGSSFPAAIHRTNELVAEWSAANGVTFEDFSGLLAGNVDTMNHPTSQGYQVLADALIGPLRALLHS